jgi:hypothetical protein
MMLCKLNPFNGLRGVVSQKVDLFLTTAMRTSNPTFVYTDLHISTRIQDKIKILRYFIQTSGEDEISLNEVREWLVQFTSESSGILSAV